MISERFAELRSKKQGAFMTHVYYGDPDEDFSLELIKTIIRDRVDIIEFGIPFSDPTADGPIFINACTRAIKNSMNPAKCVEGIRKIRAFDKNIPIIVTSYFNLVYQYGVERFIKNIKQAGGNGLIIPEAVIEESDELQIYGNKHGIDIIYLIGPYSTDERIKEIVKKASGFLYLCAVTGVTGVRENMNNSVLDLIKRTRKHTDLPLMVGFGISKPEHAKILIENGADGIIIGSAVGKIYEKHIADGRMTDGKKCLDDVGSFVKEIKGACNKGQT